MNNFYLKTLYQKRFALLWWLIGITFITFITVIFYDSFKASDIDQLFKDLPPALQGIAGDATSFKTIEGYLVQQVYALRLPLIVIILAISMLIGVSAGEEQKGLTETQLALPVSRTSLLLQKMAAAMCIILIGTFSALIGIAIALAILGESFNVGHVLQYTFNCFWISLVYGLFGFMIAALTGRRGLSLGIASGFAFLSYLINSMAPSVSSLQLLDKLTFFHYYDNQPFSIGNMLVLIFTCVVLILISVAGFNRRDIRSN